MTRVRQLPLVIVSLLAALFSGSAAQARLPDFEAGYRPVPSVVAPLPAPALPPAAGIFGSVAIPIGATSMSDAWESVRETDFTALFSEDCEMAGFGTCDDPVAAKLRDAVARAADAPAIVQLAMVNRAVNAAIRYRPDAANWGVEDKWASPVETVLAGAGDCEDYAIAKMWMLRALGFSEDQLQLVVLRDTRRDLHHAVLSVHLDGERHILDNTRWRVLPDTALPDYMPLMSFLGSTAYIHGFAAQTVMPAAGADAH